MFDLLWILVINESQKTTVSGQAMIVYENLVILGRYRICLITVTIIIKQTCVIPFKIVADTWNGANHHRVFLSFALPRKRAPGPLPRMRNPCAAARKRCAFLRLKNTLITTIIIQNNPCRHLSGNSTIQTRRGGKKTDLFVSFIFMLTNTFSPNPGGRTRSPSPLGRGSRGTLFVYSHTFTRIQSRSYGTVSRSFARPTWDPFAAVSVHEPTHKHPYSSVYIIYRHCIYIFLNVYIFKKIYIYTYI